MIAAIAAAADDLEARAAGDGAVRVVAVTKLTRQRDAGAGAVRGARAERFDHERVDPRDAVVVALPAGGRVARGEEREARRDVAGAAVGAHAFAAVAFEDGGARRTVGDTRLVDAVG